MNRQNFSLWSLGSAAVIFALTMLTVWPEAPGSAQTYTSPLPTQPASWGPRAEGQDGASAARAPARRLPSPGPHTEIAADSPAPKAAPGRVAELPASTFTMADVERFRLRVLGTSDYGGEYTVDPDQMISVPAVGRLAVGRLSVAELEALFVSKLSGISGREVAVAVEVIRFQPYYIVGHIGESGAQEWRPGLNVVQAVAMARGMRRSESGGEADTGRQLVRDQAATQLQFSLVQLARLRAEKEGSQTLTISDRLAALLQGSSPAKQSQVRAFISQQNAMLGEQNTLIELQLNALNREREAAIAELDETQVQSDQMSKQLGISRTLLKDISTLKDKQLVANSRYLQQRSELISVEIRYAEIRTLMERARSRLSAVESQNQRVQQERQSVVNDRIETLEREIAQLEVTLGETGGNRSTSSGMSMMVQIARKQDNEVRTITAGVFTAVRPYDVIIISGAAPGSAENRLAENGSAFMTLRALEASAFPSQAGESSPRGTLRR